MRESMQLKNTLESQNFYVLQFNCVCESLETSLMYQHDMTNKQPGTKASNEILLPILGRKTYFGVCRYQEGMVSSNQQKLWQALLINQLLCYFFAQNILLPLLQTGRGCFCTWLAHLPCTDAYTIPF